MNARPSHKEPLQRCDWAGSDPLYAAYHDNEWGVPLHDDRALFELLILEGFQAGLSWITILRKRNAFRKAFDGFDWRKIAAYTEKDVRRLLSDAAIVRNRLKIQAAISNAAAFQGIRDEFGSFDAYIWQFTKGRTLRARRRARTFRELPTHSPESDAMSRDLKRRGFRFVGTTICYSYMQAIGMLDDHLAQCFKARTARTA
jgi:DNA-3-methyladenine glycosylase I